MGRSNAIGREDGGLHIGDGCEVVTSRGANVSDEAVARGVVDVMTGFVGAGFPSQFGIGFLFVPVGGATGCAR